MNSPAFETPQMPPLFLSLINDPVPPLLHFISRMKRDSSEQDTEGLLPKEKLLESDSSTSFRTASKGWQGYLRTNLLSLAVILVLSISNIITLFIVFSIEIAKQPFFPSVNQPPNGVPPTFRHLVKEPTPTFINVSWYPPENSFFREHNSVDADEKWKWYDASSEFVLLLL